MKKSILTLVTLTFMLGSVNANDSTSFTSKKLYKNSITIANVSPFCKAIMNGDIDMVKKLIELGVDVNEKSLGLTPVIFAARYNKAEILKVLIANGAKLNTKCDKRGFTAKKYAEMSNAVDALAVIKAPRKA